MDKNTDESAVFETAYPRRMREVEAGFLARRRKGAGPKPAGQAEHIGFALSGGGVRSATFCLGFFQGLARRKLIRHIDYLSTVSGGGFFGTFLGRLFAREYIERVDDVDELLTQGFSGEPTADGHARPDILQWLRDNGRYLSPRGSGDLLLGLTVLLRNWVAVHVILAAFMLMFFLAAQLLPATVAAIEPEWTRRTQAWLATWPGGETIWWSLYAVLPPLFLVLWIFPVGWSYWVLAGHERPEGRKVIGPWVAWLGALISALLAMVLLDGALRWIFSGVVLAAILAGLWTFAALYAASRETAKKAAAKQAEKGGGYSSLYRDQFARHWISDQLRLALMLTVAVLAFVVIDSLGQTAYRFAILPDSQIEGWAGSVLAALIGVAASARQLAVIFSASTPAKPVGIPLNMLAAVAAGLISLFVLGGLNAVSHGVAWDFERPAHAPAVAALSAAPMLEANEVFIEPANRGWRIARKIDEAPAPPAKTQRDMAGLIAAFIVAVLFSVLFGRTWSALKYSSHHPLYSARLIRAYLGASNPERTLGKYHPVVNVIPGDDIRSDDYWRPKEPSSHYERGAPLHLINVTVNETIHSRSQLQQLDRKGVGMALGPAGLSAGIGHHVVLAGGAQDGKPTAQVYPLQREGREVYRMFGYADAYRGEDLSVGHWAGISGAAFSTGLGHRTKLSLSLLCGFGNVRLGYWWDSGVQRAVSSWRRLFPVQSFLLDEFLAHFHGSGRQHWYLSDGGHFENLGAYELIRRRLPLIVIVDAEADPHYTFDGLANLIRKARLDFHAEIRFLSDSELDAKLDPAIRAHFGPLDWLRRGAWSEESGPGPHGKTKRRFACKDEPARFSLAHAAVAEVCYEGSDRPVSWLLYIKPTLVGDEPSDLLEYHVDHPEFPQEPTADQFFDEAQWESYRRLGEDIALKVFALPEKPEAGKGVPGLFNFKCG